MNKRILLKIWVTICAAFLPVLSLSCASFRGGTVSTKAVILEKLNPQFTFVVSPVKAQGASFGPRFGEQSAVQVRIALQQMSLNAVNLTPGSLTCFSYEVRLSIYEYDYVRKLETWFSTQLCFDVYDSSGLLVASILCISESSQSAANALYLDTLIKNCTRELASAMLKLE